MFQSLHGMSGSSILGGGEVALILDVNTLCRLAEQASGSTSSARLIARTLPLCPCCAQSRQLRARFA